MFIICEQLENNILVPIIDEFGSLIETENYEEAELEKEWYELIYENKIVIIGE